ncbi:MAG: anti-sigma factor [Deltaproteobacteria bacterium]|nr:anti-sigma factor [Deltaproteobacteria bacterium]
MTCEDARLLLHPYVDGELDLATSLTVDAHLRSCVACAREETSLRALGTAFSTSGLYQNAPVQLERRVRAAVRGARRAEYGHRVAFRYFGWAGAAAAVLLVALTVRSVSPLWPSASDLTAREVVDEHLRSLTENHLTDVLSSNQHTVKPWFDGRLSFTPPVKDLSAEGFPLVGGRIDYLDDRPVAAVVYRRRQHIINLFISSAPDASNRSPVSRERAGYNIVDWTRSGMRYWAVSSLNAAELSQFARIIRNQAS